VKCQSEEKAFKADIQCSALPWHWVSAYSCSHFVHCVRISTGSLFGHPPYSPYIAPSDYHLFTYLKNWFGWQCFNSMRSWWKVLKHGSAYKWQTQVYKNLFPDMTSASVLVLTTSRSALYMYHTFSNLIRTSFLPPGIVLTARTPALSFGQNPALDRESNPHLHF
jgi:hypothetical protein